MAPSAKRLFIGGLGDATTEESLRRYFESWGKAEDATVRRSSGRGGLHGFITIVDPKNVDTILASTHTIDGTCVTVERAKWPSASARANMQCCKIFVGGLPTRCTEQALHVRTVPSDTHPGTLHRLDLPPLIILKKAMACGFVATADLRMTTSGSLVR